MRRQGPSRALQSARRAVALRTAPSLVRAELGFRRHYRLRAAGGAAIVSRSGLREAETDPTHIRRRLSEQATPWCISLLT